MKRKIKKLIIVISEKSSNLIRYQKRKLKAYDINMRE